MKLRSHVMTALLRKDLKMTLINKNTLIMLILPVVPLCMVIFFL